MKSIRVRISLILLIAMLVISLGITGAFLTGQVQSATAYDSADSTSVAQDALASSDGTPSGSLSTANDEALVASDAAVNVEVVADDELATTAATSVKQPVFQIQSGVDSKGAPTFVNHPNSTTYTTSITVSPDQTQYVRFTGVDMNEDTTTGNLTFAVSNSNYMNYTASGSNGSRTITVGIVPGTPVGNYTVTFTLKNADDAWQVTGAKSALVYTIAVTKGQVELPTLSSHDSDNDHKKTFEYTGSAQSFAFVSKYTNTSFTDIFTVTINTNQVSAGNLGNDSAASYRYNMT
ncbi:MAG: hypothetical protein K2G31_03295, partial [Clostridia bacterium]|nr:hypothetical protein [Clostridia bacterium]